jgi:hypothetical protein
MFARFLFLSAAWLAAGSAAHAITVTATQDTNALIGALLGGGGTGIHVTGVTLAGHQDSVNFGVPELPLLATLTSSGTYTNASGTYGIGPGVVLGTGGVEGGSIMGIQFIGGYGDGPNTADSNGWAFGSTFPITDDDQPGIPTTAAQDILLDPLTGIDPNTNQPYPHFDATELLIAFDMEPGFDSVSFNVVFGSEEFPEFVGSPFIDAFGLFLNGANIAFVGGKPVNIDHPDMDEVAGTELDGILAPGGNPVLTFSGAANPTGNTLRFIVTDTSDGVLDTTVYFSALRGNTEPVPEPTLGLLLAAGATLGSFVAARRRRG